MKNDNLVSVIIPVYNAEKYIKDTINSVLEQTYDPIEIIIVDDYSKDNTSVIIEEIMKAKSNIKYIKQQINQGVAVSRNLGMENSTGRFIAFLDSDDLWDKEKISKQVNFMLNNKYGFSYTAIEMIDENGVLIKKKRKIKNKVKYRTLLKNTVISTSSVVIDSSLIGKFEMPLLRSGQDYATWLILLRKNNAYGINESLTKYRKTSNSLSSNKFKSIKQVYSIQRKQEKINIFCAVFNTGCFIFNAFKKHFF